MRFLLLVTIILTPLVMRLHFIEVPLEVLSLFHINPSQPDVFNWWRNAVLYSVAGLLFLLWLRKTTFFFKCIGVYFFLVVVSCLLSKYPSVALYGMPNYLEGTIAIGSYCALFVAAMTAVPETRRLSAAMRVVTTVMFLTCALQYFSPLMFRTVGQWIIFGWNSPYQISMEVWPLFGTIMNSNILGTFAALSYAFFLARGNHLMTLFNVVMAIGSQSRGAWFAMLIANLYLVCKYRTWRLALPVAFVALGVLIMAVRPNQNNFKMTFSSSGRVYVWEKTIEMLGTQDLFFGHGPGAFAMEFPQNDPVGKRKQGWTPETIVDRPHNFYLQVIHASGGISLIALLLLLGGFLLESKEIAINAAVLSYLVNVFFTDSCTSVAPLFWILLGTGVGKVSTGRK